MRSTVLVLSLALAVGCVPKGKYDAALAESAQLQQGVEERDSQISGLSQNLADLQAQLANTQQSLDDTRDRLTGKIAETGQLQEDVAQMRLALEELEERRKRTEAAMASYRDLVGRFQSLIDAGTLQVKVIDGRMVVELATDILFPAGSASLSPEGQEALREVATVLAEIPDREYQVAGHTDNVPIRSERFPSNWYLGSARAIAVVELLGTEGLSPERISAASYAEYRPADTNETQEGKAANRRIEIIVVPDLSSLPGYDELRAIGDPEASAL